MADGSNSGAVRERVNNYRYLQVLVACLGILISLAAFYVVRDIERETERTRFEYLSATSYAIFRTQMQSFLSELRGLENFFTNSERITRDEFRGYVNPILKRYPAISSIMWVPKVGQAGRLMLENATWEDGLGGVRTFRHDDNGSQQIQPDAQQDSYFPITFIEPLARQADSVGLDLGSVDSLQTLFATAERENTIEISYLPGMVAEDLSAGDGMVVLPVKLPSRNGVAASPGPGIDTGFLVAQLDLTGSLKASTRDFETVGIDVHIYDDRKPEGERMIFGAGGFHDTAGNGLIPDGHTLDDNTILYNRALDIEGLQWRIAFSRAHDYDDISFTWLPWTVMLICLLVTGGMVMVFRSWDQRAHKMQQVVKKGEHDLALSRKQTGAIVELAAEGIITIDADGRITNFNRAAEGLFGYRAEEVIGKNVSILLPEHERSEHEEYTRHSKLYQARVIERPRDLEGLRKDGSVFPLELNIAPLDVQSGGGFVGVLRDISGRKQTELEILQQKEQLINILENTDDAYLELDWRWRVTYANPRVRDLLKVNVDEILGTDLRDTMPDVVSMFYKTLRSTMVKRESRQTVVFYGPALKYLEAKSSPTNTGVIVYFRDITERKQAEMEMIRAKELAEKESQAKTAYLSRMSHELRTPMNAVLGFSQLLEMDGDINESQLASVNEITKAGRHLLELIDDVLDVSRIEAGKYNFNYTEVSVAEIAEESVNMVREMAEKFLVHINNQIKEDNPCLLYVDAKAMRQILINLLSNAIKYNHKGGKVSLSCELTPGARVRIYVTDTGPGIKEEFHAILFDPFERLGREGDVEGTGIGLSVVKGLVGAMGGDIGMESEVGVGSTFWVEFDQVQGS